jgi:hypothetical protein
MIAQQARLHNKHCFKEREWRDCAEVHVDADCAKLEAFADKLDADVIAL